MRKEGENDQLEVLGIFTGCTKKMQKTQSVFFILIITILETGPHGFVYLHLQVTQACLLIYPVF